MWVEGEGDGRRWSTKSSQGGSAGKQSHSPRGLNCVIDFSHLPLYVFIPSDRVCLRVCVCVDACVHLIISCSSGV